MTGTDVATVPAPARPFPRRLVIAFAVGAAVAVFLGVYGRSHDPTGETVLVMFFTGQIQLKAWFATIAVLLAMTQVLTALVLYGKLGGGGPSWLGDVHRLSGTLAFLFSLPVAYHCLWSLGFNADPGSSGCSSTRCSGACSTAPSRPRCSSCGRTTCRAGRCRWRAAGVQRADGPVVHQRLLVLHDVRGCDVLMLPRTVTTPAGATP